MTMCNGPARGPARCCLRYRQLQKVKVTEAVTTWTR